MMDFLEQHFLFFQRSANPLLAAFAVGNVLVPPQVIVPVAVNRQREVVAQEDASACGDDFFSATFLPGADNFVASLCPDLLLAKYKLRIGAENGFNRRRDVE